MNKTSILILDSAVVITHPVFIDHLLWCRVARGWESGIGNTEKEMVILQLLRCAEINFQLAAMRQ